MYPYQKMVLLYGNKKKKRSSEGQDTQNLSSVTQETVDDYLLLVSDHVHPLR